MSWKALTKWKYNLYDGWMNDLGIEEQDQRRYDKANGGLRRIRLWVLSCFDGCKVDWWGSGRAHSSDGIA